MKESLLEKIESPQDLRKIAPDQLPLLAEEIREYILEVVAKNGGHLAPNLGVVELTMALHLVFDTNHDKLIWDVGHQCYTHKILTGRKEDFPSIRTYQGLSGFPKRAESPHDHFDTGHSSTSISAALGFAKARDLSGADNNVVAVIGDGALTGGLAFEALNQAGYLKSPLIVVLNDNEMSIANNVGAMSKYLVRIRTDPLYTKKKQEIEQILKKIPAVGPHVAKTLERFKESLKYFLVSGMLFEELGFVYLGPINGHNIEDMQKVFTRAKGMKTPVLIHVKTEKGKGYQPAENRPSLYHGLGSFDLDSGLPLAKSTKASYTSVFGQTLCQIAEKDQKIVAITAAMRDGTGLNEFFRSYPQRAFDVGIAEGHALTFAAGLAAAGFKPLVALYSTFLQRAYDQVVHDICLQNLPVVLAIDRAGLVGEDGPTHHGVFDISFLRHIPNLLLMTPKDEAELQRMLVTAFAHQGPVALRYPRGEGIGVDLSANPLPLPIGKGELLQAGADLTIAACGSMVYPALAAAQILRAYNIEAAVINSRFIKPLDEELILSQAQRSGRLLTVEENIKQGGFGSACLEAFYDKNLQIEISSLPDRFIEHGKASFLLSKYGLDGRGIAKQAAKRWFAAVYQDLMEDQDGIG